MSYCPLVFHIWVMKGSCCNFISIQFQTRWQPLWVCAILWEQSQRSDPGLWANLTWRSSSPLSGSLQIPVQMKLIFPIADNMCIPYRGEQCPLSVWPALKFHRWREERKVSNPWPNSQSLERAGKGAACLWPPCQLAWLVTETCQKGKVLCPISIALWSINQLSCWLLMVGQYCELS